MQAYIRSADIPCGCRAEEWCDTCRSTVLRPRWTRCKQWRHQTAPRLACMLVPHRRQCTRLCRRSSCLTSSLRTITQAVVRTWLTLTHYHIIFSFLKNFYLPEFIMEPLPWQQNAATSLIFELGPCKHITLCDVPIHSLLLRHCITYKLCVMYSVRIHP